MDLGRLQHDVAEARLAHRASLRGRSDITMESATRAELLLALRALVGALDERRLPVPPTLQREVRILASLARYPGPPRRRGGKPLA